MKNLLSFLFLFAFCFGFSQTKDSLSAEEKARREKNIQAGNPFKKFGYTPKIATLSKGKYLEWHDLDTIVQVGTFMYNTRSKTIVSIIEHDTLPPSEATLKPEIVSRWMSPDPLSEEYPSWSPYNFVMNNPINAIDPDGREVVWLNWGGNYSGIIRALNKSSTFNNIFTRFIKNQDNVFISPSSGGYFGYAPSTRGANGYNIKIGANGFLKNGMLTADATMIAKVVMHEGLHSRYHMARAEGNQADYPTLDRHMNIQATTSGYEGDHEAMAEGNVGTLVQGMKEFDNSYGTTHSEDWYNAMAWWGSLSRATDDWNNLDATTKATYTAIQNNESQYMSYLEAKATYQADKNATNKTSMISARKTVDWRLYNKTRSNN